MGDGEGWGRGGEERGEEPPEAGVPSQAGARRWGPPIGLLLVEEGLR